MCKSIILDGKIMYRLSYDKIGKQIKENRTKQGLTLEQLAEKTGLSVSHINHVERADNAISLPALVEIANVLNISVDRLLRDNLNDPKPEYQQEIFEMLDSASLTEVKQLYDLFKTGLKVIENILDNK